MTDRAAPPGAAGRGGSAHGVPFVTAPRGVRSTRTAGAPDAASLLDIWERGRSAVPIHRTLLLLELADPESADESFALRIGEQNALLLRLRAALFGTRLDSVTDCPACGTVLELAIDAAELLSHHDPMPLRTPGGVMTEDADGVVVTFRLPVVGDVLVAVNAADPGAALLERCIVAGDEALPLSPVVAERLARRMAAADPLADPEIALRCPGCAHEWALPFDVSAFVWTEIDAYAWRILGEVHRLGRAYGWTEAESLALSAARRRAYLTLVDG